MRLGHLFGQILPIVQNASAASTVTGGFCLFSQVSLPGSEILDPGSSREFPGIPTPGNSHFRSLAYYTRKGDPLKPPQPKIVRPFAADLDDTPRFRLVGENLSSTEEEELHQAGRRWRARQA